MHCLLLGSCCATPRPSPQPPLLPVLAHAVHGCNLGLHLALQVLQLSVQSLHLHAAAGTKGQAGWGRGWSEVRLLGEAGRHFSYRQLQSISLEQPSTKTTL